eukprot:COSAG06_NODE_62285_length_265_cov_0.927711_1_plen_73_part_01
MIVVALGFHSVLEGLALGVVDDKSEILALLVTILVRVDPIYIAAVQRSRSHVACPLLLDLQSARIGLLRFNLA